VSAEGHDICQIHVPEFGEIDCVKDTSEFRMGDFETEKCSNNGTGRISPKITDPVELRVLM
jgi:hypothetical protein